MPVRLRLTALLVAVALVVALSACSISVKRPEQQPPLPVVNVNNASAKPLTPQKLRAAYGVDALIAKGDDGHGQTVVVIDSFGSPTLQQDFDAFNQQFNLPALTLTVLAPLGTVAFDASNSEMTGWASETTLDVEMIHAIAPGANIVVLTSPVDETEGTAGLPEFLKLEQYAVDHHLGSIISQSFGASEYTLRDQAGQDEIHQWDTFLQQATTQQGVTFLAASGDEGATDLADADVTAKRLVPATTSSFPNDDPWVTAVGGTTLLSNGGNYVERAWGDGLSGSGGGFSAFFPAPSYQKNLPASVKSLANNRRGLPDVAADADPSTGLLIVQGGSLQPIGGTSAATPLWAGVVAIADQVAGHPLGFINPALYQIETSTPSAFHDITIGNNSISAGSAQVKGYAAGPGWDAVTGLGSPNAGKLIPALAAASPSK